MFRKRQLLRLLIALILILTGQACCLPSIKIGDAVAPSRDAASDNKLIGKWAKSSSGTRGLDPSGNILNSAYYMSEYTFEQDGSYSFKGEKWAGYIKADEYWMIDESGTYVVAENLLTVIPRKSTSTVKSRAGVLLRRQNNQLEKTSYRWVLHYFAGIDDTNLILQTETETERDGIFGSNDAFPKSYFFSQKYKPDWKFE